MPLNREDVKGLADLARLELSEEELKLREKELEAILGYVDRLQQIDTAGVEPYTIEETDVWRPDVALPTDDLARELLLANFPSRKGELLHVPPVFEAPKK